MPKNYRVQSRSQKCRKDFDLPVDFFQKFFRNPIRNLGITVEFLEILMILLFDLKLIYPDSFNLPRAG